RAIEALAQQLSLLDKLREKGVDLEKMWNAYRDYRERFNMISASALPTSPMTFLGRMTFGAPVVTPPYTSLGHNDSCCGDACADLRFLSLGNFTNYKDDASGTSGSLITVLNIGIDEADAHARGAYWDTNWQFWYTPPSTGPLTIGADVVPLGAAVNLAVQDNA